MNAATARRRLACPAVRGVLRWRTLPRQTPTGPGNGPSWWHHDRVDAGLTLAEAAQLLDPPMTERQLRMIIRALGIPPAGTRPSGHRGRPILTYRWSELAGLHQALVPWLELTYPKRRTTVLPGTQRSGAAR